jgi:ParB family chromosome partitioning protein
MPNVRLIKDEINPLHEPKRSADDQHRPGVLQRPDWPSPSAGALKFTQGRDISRRPLCGASHCASFAVNAVYEPANRYNEGRVSAHGVRTPLDQVDVLVRAVGLDMVQAGWKPTVDNYLGRVTKPRILEAVREAKGEPSAQLIDYLKKGDMAKEAERLLDGSGWLPEPLRLVAVEAEPVQQEPAERPLPEFLSENEEQDAAAEEERPQQLDAAE